VERPTMTRPHEDEPAKRSQSKLPSIPILPLSAFSPAAATAHINSRNFSVFCYLYFISRSLAEWTGWEALEKDN
jgi:hypothetical protein